MVCLQQRSGHLLINIHDRQRIHYYTPIPFSLSSFLGLPLLVRPTFTLVSCSDLSSVIRILGAVVEIRLGMMSGRVELGGLEIVMQLFLVSDWFKYALPIIFTFTFCCAVLDRPASIHAREIESMWRQMEVDGNIFMRSEIKRLNSLLV